MEDEAEKAICPKCGKAPVDSEGLLCENCKMGLVQAVDVPPRFSRQDAELLTDLATKSSNKKQRTQNG
jgi:hypothetical protein